MVTNLGYTARREVLLAMLGLVVEDEQDVAQLIRYNLAKEGEDGFVEPRTVDVHVARLRARFSAARAPMPGIETVRGVGYRFREPEAGRG